ncbi:MAG: M48 family metallopeptidase [Candidatus Thermoplasmatota archaeon]|jgi:predicted metal-dependent hydrolase|nr:M48 family metallopeptidase [Candidatus Thermoplasmatota archaeon]
MERSEFLEEVKIWTRRIGVEPREIQIRDMKRKWGSCSSKGRLTFNSILLSQSRSKIKEVIVHEILHLKYERHDTLFKALLSAYISDNFFEGNGDSNEIRKYFNQER